LVDRDGSLSHHVHRVLSQGFLGNGLHIYYIS
jgi:hypothetical protein